jgi:hypothetical protein
VRGGGAYVTTTWSRDNGLQFDPITITAVEECSALAECDRIFSVHTDFSNSAGEQKLVY